MLDVIAASPVGSPMLHYKLPLLRTREFEPQMTTELLANDIGLILAAAQAKQCAGLTVFTVTTNVRDPYRPWRCARRLHLGDQAVRVDGLQLTTNRRSRPGHIADTDKSNP